MALFTSAETDAMLADAPGVAITYSAQTTNGFLDLETVEEMQADGLRVIGDQLAVWIRNGSLTSLTMDAAITVGGSSYKIHDIGTPLTNGMRRILLVEA